MTTKTPACTECGLTTNRLVDGKCRNVASCNRRRARNGENPYLDVDLHDQTRIFNDHLPSEMNSATKVRQAFERKRCKQSEADAADYAFRDSVRDARRQGYTAETIALWTGLTPSRIYQIWGYRRV